MHLFSKGFDVELSDIESIQSFDFLASKEDVQYEVECKSVTADIGRPIHQRKMVDLGHKLVSRLEGLNLSGGLRTPEQ